MNSLLIRVISRNTRVINYINRTKVSKNVSNNCWTLHYVTQHRQFSNQISKEVYLIDENENNERREKIVNKVNKYTERSFTCGELRLEHVASKVTICGWLAFQRMGKFFVLRDGYGQTQCIIDEKDEATQKQLEALAYESILKVEGAVVARPKNMVNKKQTTGEIEVLISKLTVLNEVKQNLPFNIREFQKAKESLRMQYRYLDMRFPQMQRYMRLRSEVTNKMREFLVKHAGFVDVETPTLFKKTPGGAQEFVVPTRFPKQFYSLVQSPQQFKQMLMAGAIDRYFQVARCYRDETSRPDRQPEFTQLDIEMSFTNMEGVMELIEDLLQYSWPSFLQPLPFKFPRMQYKEAMESYGTDKPDVRYDFKIKNCTDILKANPKFATTENFYAGCLVFEEPYINLPKSLREKFAINQYPGTNLVLNKISNVDEFIKKTANLFTEPIVQRLCEELNITKNSVLFLVYGKKTNALKRLGKLREDYVNHLEEHNFKIKKDGMHIVWLIDFPLFEEGDETGSICATHHPFAAPNCDDLHLLITSPFEVRGQSYDLVLNGNEIAGGSMRIHDGCLQKNILDMLKIDSKYLKHMLDMLDSGCPPHGGIAVGLDRLFSVILDTPSIRDVIAFPKTFEGKDPLSGAPSPISDEDKKLYHIFK